MNQFKEALVNALKSGQEFTYTVPLGGDLASMRAVLRYGQQITLSPVTDFSEVHTGDIVYLRWRGGGYILHIVKEVEGEQFLIINSLGKVNGWVHGSAIIGRVSKIVEPAPRPPVPDLLTQLRAASCAMITRMSQPESEVGRRLLSVVEDMEWYAARIGVERWAMLPRQNAWSFESNLFYLVERAQAWVSQPERELDELIDLGKRIVGECAECLGRLNGREWDW